MTTNREELKKVIYGAIGDNPLDNDRLALVVAAVVQLASNDRVQAGHVVSVLETSKFTVLYMASKELDKRDR